VSPQNVIVGSDGSARVLDFGIAKAAGRAQVTREGQIKGKLAYMAPEQIRGQVDRRTDVFAAAVVLWEMLAGRRLHGTAKDVDIVARIVQGNLTPPSEHAPHITPELDDIVMRALVSDPKKRIASALDLALELERKVGLASPSEGTAWVERLAADILDARANLVTAMELAARDLLAIATNPPPPGIGAGTPMDFIPASAQIPVHFDPSHAPYTEVPSSSAVFAHAQTTPGAANASAGSRTIDRSTVVIVALSCAMALIGVALGAYSLVHRAARAEHPTTPMNAPTATVLARGVAVPSSVPSAVAPPDVEAEPTATASGSSTATATAPAFTAKPPAVLPAPPGGAPAVRKPVGKPSCDPPYTVDDVGHRHYKPECMGLE
jgi:hypothetical protein